MKRSVLTACLSLVLLTFFIAGPGFSQTPDELKNLRKEMDEIKETQLCQTRP